MGEDDGSNRNGMMKHADACARNIRDGSPGHRGR